MAALCAEAGPAGPWDRHMGEESEAAPQWGQQRGVSWACLSGASHALPGLAKLCT